ncbi:hypothetical protein C8E83_2010 [Frondihabitans australicus]|uniref:Bacteriocin biosynthesis cyclodehydratase domain-containing protein n=1 Tax=Frondihabitans australicus TaxID=386892 RepID=A0A495IIE4_9MICO|nr:hypothetical protein C8E83_2010 [Frondihabitans australicus]
MDIRFDPRLPLVWRDPHTLQIGADRPVVVLERITAREERVVSAIASGHGLSGLGGLIARTGQRDAEVATIVERLAPALAEPRKVRRPVVEVAGSCNLTRAIEALLTASDASVRRVDATSAGLAGDADAGVAVSRHAHDPAVAAAWLRVDLPHLTVVTGDRSTRVGPVVVPGRTACSHCLDLHRADVDASWGVIAAQLWGRVGPALPPVAQSEVAAKAVRRILRRHEALAARHPGAPVRDGPAKASPGESDDDDRARALDEASDDAVIETIDTDSGRVTSSRSRLHPGCGCAALAESGWGGDPDPSAPAPHGSTTAGGDPEHG